MLKGQAGAMPVFRYFQDLRDKHIIHDENPYSQSYVALALNAENTKFKVADVISLAINAFTADDSHLQSFSQLVQFTLEWVEHKRDELHNLLGARYESENYEALMLLPNIEYRAPTANEIALAR